MHIIYTHRHQAHATDQVLIEGRPFNSYEVPTRAEIILNTIQAEHLGVLAEPSDHGLEPILAIHDADYVNFLRGAYNDSATYFNEAGPVFTWTFAVRHAIRRPKGILGLKGYYAFDQGTPILEGTWEAAYWSAQCALTAADLVRDGERVAYALCRPPGHHAAADLYGGYCYLNNAAIATRYLQSSTAGKAPKVVILDVDYHHGNGTQLIFYADPSVFYGSLHAHPDEAYPYYWGGAEEIGAGLGIGTNRNWPLPRGTGDEAYLATLDEALAVVRGFAPQYLVLSIGLDTVEGDPEGGFCMTTDGLAEIGRRCTGLGLPTVIVQEGGYLLNGLSENALAFLRPFAHWDP